MGLSSKKTKTVSDSHQVIAPTNPTQVTSGLTGMADKITNLQNLDPYSFTAGADPLQTQAATTAGGLGAGMPGAMDTFHSGLGNATGITNDVAGSAAPSMTAAHTTAANMGTGATAYGGIGNYLSPYTNDVVNTTLTGFDKNAGLQRAQANLGLAGDTTFGGSGGSIYKALLESNLGLDRASTEAGLRDKGWNTALSAAQQDAERAQAASLANAGFAQQTGIFNAGNDQETGRVNAGLADSNLTRRLAAGGQLGSLASTGLSGDISADTNSRANIDSQSAQGDIMRQIQLQHNLAPLTSLSAISGLWGSTPFGLLHGEDNTSHSNSTQTVSDPMGTIGSLVGAAGSLATGLGGLGLKLPGAAASGGAYGWNPSMGA